MAEKKQIAQADHVKHGSDPHAALLGLKKALKEDELQLEGWTLIDTTMFGPQVTDRYLKEVLRQKVATLKAGPPPVPQPEDPRAPNYAPPLWVPKEAPIDQGIR